MDNEKYSAKGVEGKNSQGQTVYEHQQTYPIPQTYAAPPLPPPPFNPNMNAPYPTADYGMC